MNEPVTQGRFDVDQVRKDFPILSRDARGKPLVYLDSANTSQKPQAVIDSVARYYRTTNANIHRAVHALGEEATQAHEDARARIARFVGEPDPNRLVFVRGTTEAINLVAQSFVRPRLAPGDEVLITHLEHHSNIVPWQLVCEQTDAVLRVVPIDDRGQVDPDAFEELLGERTRIASFAHVSNALGTILPVRRMIELAHAHGVPVLVDGAQSVPHLRVDVRELDCDFYAFSSHKTYGPTGIGALVAKSERLEEMVPYQGGGEMIASVSFEHTTYNRVPYRFEAGTPNIAGAVGFGAAVDYLESLDLEGAWDHEERVLEYGTRQLGELPDVKLIGTAEHKTGVLSFCLEGVHPHDVATILDQDGIAVRAGHHCAQPVMQRFGVPATTRASLGLYNTTAEIDRLVAGVARVREIFGS